MKTCKIHTRNNKCELKYNFKQFNNVINKNMFSAFFCT